MTQASLLVPGAVVAGTRITPTIGLQLGAGGSRTSIDVSMKLQIDGPASKVIGTLTKQYPPGAAVATTSFFSVDTTGLPSGLYTATLFVGDSFGNYRKVTDAFEISGTATAATTATIHLFAGTVIMKSGSVDVEVEVDMTGTPKVVGGEIAKVKVRATPLTRWASGTPMISRLRTTSSRAPSSRLARGRTPLRPKSTWSCTSSTAKA